MNGDTPIIKLVLDFLDTSLRQLEGQTRDQQATLLEICGAIQRLSDLQKADPTRQALLAKLHEQFEKLASLVKEHNIECSERHEGGLKLGVSEVKDHGIEMKAIIAELRSAISSSIEASKEVKTRLTIFIGILTVVSGTGILMYSHFMKSIQALEAIVSSLPK